MSKTCFVLQVVFEYALCSFDHMYIPNLSHPAFSSIGGRDSQCWRAYSGGSGREEELFFEAHPGEQTWCCIFGDLVTWCHYSWNDSWWKNIIYIYIRIWSHIYIYDYSSMILTCTVWQCFVCSKWIPSAFEDIHVHIYNSQTTSKTRVIDI